MFGFTVIKKSELQKLRLSEKALLAQSEQLINERNEIQMKYNLAQLEVKKYKPVKGEKGRFVKKNQ